ncbi:helicase C-terminal domain-containing protein [Weissella halotolerans]|uniref:3'-5' exonuclease DinG n=1 Tax=Weissella halotolerans DSM 20190 TaxID=1123500 RepID=A0A0R2G8Q8_9LACO|nr:helicase C-terminal domain-containing protein [Weissella halotolerans]KRN33578.1 helicase [Weissella halotolerans DSM 20190]
MKNKDIYAVVDLETTRTSTETGHIIQIAIAFVQDQKIINQFSTLINPGETIPRQITELTGITTKMVQHAPRFEDIGLTVHAMLTGTIFVAHNVNFDLPFLNAEFERIGLTPLAGPALDTVPLSQILWPTTPGFSLGAMAKFLQIEHRHPHQADSDALTTARLLIKILHKAKHLPMVTLQALVNLPMTLPRETHRVFEQALKENQQAPGQLPPFLEVIDGLAIRRFSKPTPLKQASAFAFPKKAAQKRTLLTDPLVYREQQGKLMNLIDSHYHQLPTELQPGQGGLVLEAPTGMGKTLGYLLPYAYLANETGKQVVVSVPTVNLQQTVTETVGDQLNERLPFEVRAASLKGRQHYLNLQSFRRSLTIDEGSNAFQMIKAQLLVWLTETLTGDLDEVNLVNPQADFMAKLTQIANNPAGSPFKGHEFFDRQKLVAQQAQFIVVNHAYLATYAKELGQLAGNKPYLVIDEPQHLPDAVLHQGQHRLAFPKWIDAVGDALNRLTSHHEETIIPILQRIGTGEQLKSEFQANLTQLQGQLPKLVTALYRQFLLGQHHPNLTEPFEKVLPEDQLAIFWRDQADLLQVLLGAVYGLNQTLDAFLAAFSQVKHAFSLTERQTLADFRRSLGQITRAQRQLTQFQQDLLDYPAATVFWLTEFPQAKGQALMLSGGLLHTFDYFADRVYPYFMPPTLIGATLFTSNRSSFLYDRLNLDRSQTEAHQFKDVFDYAHQAELFMVTDGPSPMADDYVNYVTKEIEAILAQVQENTLILFNSLDMIEQAFTRLQENHSGSRHNMTILAQGVTGTRTRILKRMQHEQRTVVLGANSFWEGINLPKEQVRLVIITRLPFEQPNSVPAKAEEAVLKAQGRQPFYQNTLPKAVMRLRQGVGRLLRSPEDYGAVVILDSRITTKKYGKTLKNMLPKALPQRELAKKDLPSAIANFFREHR